MSASRPSSVAVRVRGRLKQPVALLSADPDDTLSIRIDDNGDPGFWLEIVIRPEDLAVLAPPSED
jgi:hypothetical protein